MWIFSVQGGNSEKEVRGEKNLFLAVRARDDYGGDEYCGF